MDRKHVNDTKAAINMKKIFKAVKIYMGKNAQKGTQIQEQSGKDKVIDFTFYSVDWQILR